MLIYTITLTDSTGRSVRFGPYSSKSEAERISALLTDGNQQKAVVCCLPSWMYGEIK